MQGSLSLNGVNMQQEAGRAGALLTIDLKALRANFRFLQSRLGASQCGAAVKADAYGLGAIPVSKALVAEGCRHLFVAQLEEAICLRQHIAPEVAIYVMHGSPVGYEAEFIEYACTPVLNSLEQIRAWQALAKERLSALPAVVQIDTGMARMGLSQSELRAWLNDASLTEGIDLRFVMSHLACAEDQLDPMNQLQLQAFNQILAQLRQTHPDLKASFANSSGIFLGSEFHFDFARPGAALYGVAPMVGQANPMQSVVQLQGRIIQTREIPMGASVGYSKTWRATQPSRIATVSVGYADGWLRSLSNCGIAHIAGIEVPMVGNVSMDTITLNVSHVDPQLLVPGALVDLICPQNTVDQVAKRAGTIGYEILTSLGPRYQRHYVDI